MIPKNRLLDSQHATLVIDSLSFGCGSALYSYLLTQHKKVSLVSKKPLDKKYEVVPWYKAIRVNIPTSSDYVYEVVADVSAFYNFLQSEPVRMNEKMATALYAALLLEYDNFQSAKTDGSVFALAHALIEAGADYKNVRLSLYNTQPLSLFRLQGRLFQKMQLQKNATEALLTYSQDDLQATGASYEDVISCGKSALRVAHVQELLIVEEETKTLKITLKD